MMNPPANTSPDAVKTTENQFGTKLLFACAAGIFVIVFAPALLLQFGVVDDYWIGSYTPHGWLSHPATTHLFWIGRPIGALLLNLHFMLFDTIKSLAVGRALSLVTLVITVILTTTILERHIGVSRLVSVSLSTLIFLLPGSLVYVLWLVCFHMGMLNILLACVAYYLVSRSYSRGLGIRSRSGFVLGYGFLLVSFYIYPATSYFFLVFTLSKLLLGAEEFWERRRRQALAEIGAVVLLSGVYFLSTKLWTPFLMHALFGTQAGVQPQGSYQFALAGGLWERLPVLREYASSSGGLWWTDLAPATMNILWLALLFLAGVVIVFIRSSSRGALSHALQRLLLALVTLAVSTAPWLLAAGGFVQFRNTFATSAMVVVWLVAIMAWTGSQSRFLSLGNALLLFLCVVAAAAAAIRIASASYNWNAELEFVRKEVAGFDRSVKEVILLLPPTDDVIVHAPLALDFGQMATNHVPFDGIVRAAMKERGLPGETVLIKMLPWESKSGPIQYAGADVPVIDMAQAGFRKVPSPRMLRTAAVTAFPLSGCCGPQLAFDRNASTFFESDAGFPVDLTVSYPGQCRTVVQYRYSAHLLPNLMPSAWQLLGRIDTMTDWQLLDSRSGVSGWSDFSSQVFQIAEPACFSEYSFRFLKSGDPKLMRIAEIALDDRQKTSPRDSLQKIQIAASSILEPWGPEGLLESQQPGWHVKSPRYPERLELRFISPLRISRIGFLPQSGNVLRAPQDVVVERSEDGKTWEPVAKLKNSCDGPDSEWRMHSLGQAIKAHYLRIEILSNCGVPDLLTLRGLKFE